MSSNTECPICGKRADTSSHSRYCIPKNLYCECGNPATNFRKWRQGICQRCTAFIRTLGLWESSATLSESFPNGTTYTRSYQVFLPNPNQLNQ